MFWKELNLRMNITFYVFVCFLSFFVFLFGCSGDEEESEERENEFREVPQPQPIKPCRTGDSELLDNLDEIRSSNAGKYKISGRCDPLSRDKIEVSIENQVLEIPCNRQRWSDDLDLTGIVQGNKELDISVSQGSKSSCRTVQNDFDCPDDYIAVQRLDDYTDDDFCVMKYEARKEGGDRNNNQGEPVSKSGGEAWTGLNHEQASAACKRIGTGYRLISNDEWQTIARNIESEKSNWSSKEITIREGNYLNTGNNIRGVSSPVSGWEPDKESHILKNGQEIYNFAGGVWEMVSDLFSELDGATKTKINSVSKLQGEKGGLKEHFGPKNNYLSLDDRENRGNVAGLGIVDLDSTKEGVSRGGKDRNAGIFSVQASQDIEATRGPRDVGFRCVYRF